MKEEQNVPRRPDAVADEWNTKGCNYFRKAHAEQKRSYFAKALKCFKEAKKIEPQCPMIWYHITLTFICMDRYREAREAGREAFSLIM